MSRYPFQAVVNEVLAAKSLIWSSINAEKMNNRFRLMREEFEALYELSKISTLNPKRMTVKEINVYLEFCSTKTHPYTGEPISAGEIKRTIGTFKHLVEYPYMVRVSLKL